MGARRTALAVVAALVGLGGARCGLPLGPERPDLLLVTIDTLRADHLPFYGHGRYTAPFLGKLAAEGVVFDHAARPRRGRGRAWPRS